MEPLKRKKRQKLTSQLAFTKHKQKVLCLSFTQKTANVKSSKADENPFHFSPVFSCVQIVYTVFNGSLFCTFLS